MQLAEGSMAILCTLNRLQHKYKKDYCFPSQAKLLDLLWRWYGITYSRRTLNRRLSMLDKHCLISRTRRHKVSRVRGMEFHSTLYRFTFLGAIVLRRMGVLGKRVYDWIQEKYEDARRPKVDGLTDHTTTRKGVYRGGAVFMNRGDLQARQG